jgi:RNA polymerase sigma-70 factor (ECF subfamily)
MLCGDRIRVRRPRARQWLAADFLPTRKRFQVVGTCPERVVVMPEDADFTGLMARAKSGDPEAVRDFLSRFDQEVRMMVRARLPKRLRARFDSTDFVQAVWQSFFSDLPGAAPDFASPEHLRKFLAGVVRNKVFEQHRRYTRTEKYDVLREEPLYVRRGGRDVPREVVSPDPSPSQTAQASDRLAQLTTGCSPREVEVLTLRHQGLTLDEIAERTGVNERTVRRIIESARARLEVRRW